MKNVKTSDAAMNGKEMMAGSFGLMVKRYAPVMKVMAIDRFV